MHSKIICCMNERHLRLNVHLQQLFWILFTFVFQSLLSSQGKYNLGLRDPHSLFPAARWYHLWTLTISWNREWHFYCSQSAVAVSRQRAKLLVLKSLESTVINLMITTIIRYYLFCHFYENVFLWHYFELWPFGKMTKSCNNQLN